jgi:Mlc titration factor MtfA (ptsG expression regulator)
MPWRSGSGETPGPGPNARPLFQVFDFRTRRVHHSRVGLDRFGFALASALGRIFGPRRTSEDSFAAFPQSWKHFLEARSDHYRRLPPAYRREFQQQVQIFLAAKRITGVELHVTEEIELLVAASAVTLSVGWPGFVWDRLTEVLVYPDNFDRDYNFGGSEIAGQAHPWGVVILSAPVLLASFAESGDGSHLGYHEFAHLLDLSQTGGIPASLSDESIREWMMIMKEEEERLRRGDSELSPYGLSGPRELFAVAVEAFFQTPLALLQSHTKLYSFLSSYFCQDPAAWVAPGS